MPIDKEFLSKFIGANIKGFRKEKGLSQRELANKVDLSQSSIAQYERGDLFPSLESIYKISFALEISVSDLCDVSHDDYVTARQRNFEDASLIIIEMYQFINSIDKKRPGLKDTIISILNEIKDKDAEVSDEDSAEDA